ncbi:CitMHS family transporter [Staphylococcus kloosii]|jgi:CitMHS family citrate-Mg2+:H+ or citrate-Ca2+:H+ symporter|uniref:Citrate transporter n=2 Tax=Staphylococcus kloosii TaxID=29384 RepID=A0A921GZI1_9STAP|nr:citrate:proton symporter [Staphylococcus kloosii]AVQ36742.1 citrate transporter [Staphylococcus kloosii]MBF7022650.1 citrate transporter [Staphylococcus kloosii]MBF7028762.1 citrate transporter [Staphylococcus kloosii]MCD8878123.1 citrate:proton symporter [Staphylococcus kloosii]PTJ75075.1 citrate transporter [Staphylococcus kloosii]
MYLAILGFIMIAVFMILIMTRKMSALIALIVIPTIFALIGGFYAGIGKFMLDGIGTVAPTGIMLTFAILYFGVMIDAGLFEPVIKLIIKVVKGDPVKIAIGTVLLASMVALDGDGTTTFIITVTAMMPLYKKIGMSYYILSTLALLSIGVMNMLPWGGPTARAISSLHLQTEDVFIPIIPAMIAGIIFALAVAVILGNRSKKYINSATDIDTDDIQMVDSKEDSLLKRPKMIIPNAILTISLIVCLLIELLPIPVLFMVWFGVALLINYPNLSIQNSVVKKHAGDVLAVISLVFASGIFTGIMDGTKMVDEMAHTLVQIIPEALGSHFALITAILSGPFTYFMANDPFYYGVLPILAESAHQFGISKVAMARASVLGQPLHVLSPLYAAGYLLVGMLDIEYGRNQRIVIKWAIGSSLFMIFVALILGIIPW